MPQTNRNSLPSSNPRQGNYTPMKGKDVETLARSLSKGKTEQGRSKYRRDYGRRVGYNKTTLGQEVARMREPGRKPKIPTERNLAAARLSDGRTLTGISGRRNGADSEIDILEQLDDINAERAARGESRLTVTHAYSERQPCLGCQGALQSAAPRADIQWTVEYSDKANPTDVERDDLRVLNTMSRTELNQAISDTFR